MLSTTIPNFLPRAAGKSVNGTMLNRELAAAAYSREMGALPSSNITVARIVPANAEVLATRTYVSTSRLPPSSPSAMAHRVPVVVSPGLLCASCHVSDVGPGHHIARSTMIGTSLVEVMRVDTATSANAGSAWSTQMLKRLLPATWYVLVIT